MADASETLDLLQRLGLALAIGFLVGIERGWKQREDPAGERVAGLRTFALAGLLGGIAGLILQIAGPLPSSAIAVAFSAAFILFQLRRTADERNSSVTSTVAGLLVFSLGCYTILGNLTLAAAAGVATTLILAFKDRLHGWLRSLTWVEIRSALLILAAAFIVLPLLPAGPIDPWGALDLRSLWLLTVVIALASFGGYLVLRSLGARLGLVAGALIGATVSSTAVTLDLARRVRLFEVPPSTAAAAASVAAIASLARTLVLAGVFSFELALRLWPGVAAAAFVCAVGAAFWLMRAPAGAPRARLEGLRSPLNLVSVARFAAVLAGLTIAANLVSRMAGDGGLFVFATTAGLADVDAVTLAVGKQVTAGLNADQAAGAVGLAIAANQVFKTMAALAAGSSAFAIRFGGVVMAAAVAAAGLQLALAS